MNYAKKLFALLLAVVIVLSVSACFEADPDNSTIPSQGENLGGLENPYPWLNTDGSFPIVNEGYEKTLTIYCEQTAEYGDPEASWFFHYLEEELNINLEITTYTADNKTEFLSLAFASDELPDIIIGANYNTNELLHYGEVEEQLLDIAPYINSTFMPNLNSLFEEEPALKSQITSPNGNIWSLGKIGTDNPRGGSQRYFLNYEWLEQLNLEVPTTLDGFIDTMRAFKAAGLCEYPIGGAYASEHPGQYILNAMGYVGARAKAYNICLRNGKVVLPMADREAFGDYLKIMNTLYTEGLIHPDFFTMSRDSIYAEFSKGQGFIQQAPFVCVGLENQNQYWCALPLTSQWNDTAAVPVSSVITIGGVVITSSCKEPELAAKFIDAFYGSERDNVYIKSIIGPNANDADILYGMVSGYVLDGGAPSYVDYLNNKNLYISTNDYLYKKVALWNAGAFGLDTWARDLSSPTYAGEPDASQYEDPSVLRNDPTLNADGDKFYQYAMQTVLTPYVTYEVYPSISFMDAELAAEYDALSTAMRSYGERIMAQFITGARPLTDAELDAYFDGLEALGAKEYVEAYQAYYDSLK